MAIENKPGDQLDTVFGQSDSSEVPSHRGHDTASARIFKIIVIGDSSVGKTCLTYRFCGGSFLNNPEATIGVDFREKTLDIDGESIKVIRVTCGSCHVTLHVWKGWHANTHTHTRAYCTIQLPGLRFGCGRRLTWDRFSFQISAGCACMQSSKGLTRLHLIA